MCVCVCGGGGGGGGPCARVDQDYTCRGIENNIPSIQYLPQVGGFLRVLRFPHPEN